MWIKHGNPQCGVVLVTDEAHIARLLSEGGVEVGDPRVVPVEVRSDASTINDVAAHSPRPTHDRRSGRRKPAVR